MTLPRDLQLHVLGFLKAYDDCAAFLVADPRTGLHAMRNLPRFKDPIVHVAMLKLRLNSQIPGGKMGMHVSPSKETALAYLDDARLTKEGVQWLRAQSQDLESAIKVKAEIIQGHERTMLTMGGSLTIISPKGYVILSRSVQHKAHRIEYINGHRLDGQVFFYEDNKWVKTTYRARHKEHGKVEHIQDNKTVKIEYGKGHAENGKVIHLKDGRVSRREYLPPHSSCGRVDWYEGSTEGTSRFS